MIIDKTKNFLHKNKILENMNYAWVHMPEVQVISDKYDYVLLLNYVEK